MDELDERDKLIILMGHIIIDHGLLGQPGSELEKLRFEQVLNSFQEKVKNA